MKRFPWVVLGVGVVCAALVWMGHAQVVGQSPDAWRQLSLAEFVREIEQLTTAAEPVSDELWTEIRAQSAERLLGAVAGGVSAEYSDLVSLYLWARPHLTPEQNATVLAGLTPQANQVSSWTFNKLRSVHARMSSAEIPASSLHNLAIAWLAGRDVRTLEDADHMGWLLGEIQSSQQADSAPREISVRWTGTIQVPADGEYTLSISPLNLDFQRGRGFRRQTMSIWVAGQQVLDSTGGGWTYRARQVTLSAAQKMPLRVDFSYTCSSPSVFADRPAVAVLWWEGAGLSQRLVPTTALATPDGRQEGLQGEYTLRSQGGEESQRRVDPQINFIWYGGGAVFSPHNQLQAALAAQLYAVASAAGTLSSWETAGKARQADWVGASSAMLRSLSVAQRKEWAQTLIAHPALLADCAPQGAANLYHHGRLGAPNLALQVWGTWAQAHAEEVPVLGVDFYRVNRQLYRQVAGAMVWECQEHREQLEVEFLTLPAGRCALPAAYALAYSYWAEERIGQWIEKLDARLGNEQLTGDDRVGWLLARAGGGNSAQPRWPLLAHHGSLPGRSRLDRGGDLGRTKRSGALAGLSGIGRAVDHR